jgi:hypothetical protein
LESNTAWFVASGDLRASANIVGWATEAEMERTLESAFAEHLGWRVHRVHPFDPEKGDTASSTIGAPAFRSLRGSRSTRR